LPRKRRDREPVVRCATGIRTPGIRLEAKAKSAEPEVWVRAAGIENAAAAQSLQDRALRAIKNVSFKIRPRPGSSAGHRAS